MPAPTRRPKPGGPLYWSDNVALLREHIEHMELSDRAPSTMMRRRMVLCFLEEFLGHDPGDATLVELKAWQASLLPSKAQVLWKTAMIRPYYAFLQAYGYRPDNPAALLPRPKVKYKVRRPMSDEDLFAAVLAAPMPVLAMLLFGGWSGMRAVEIAGLRREDLYLAPDGRWWATVTGKGGAERDVPIPRWVYDRVADELPGFGPLFVKGPQAGAGAGQQVSAGNVTDRVGEYLSQIGISDRLHSLRHRVATAAWQATRDVRVVQQLLGHANLAVLHVYTHVHDDAVADAVDRIPRPFWPTEDDDPGLDDAPEKVPA